MAITTMSSVCASDMSDDIVNDTCDKIELNENNDINTAMEEKSNIDASSEHSSNEILKYGKWRTFTELQELIRMQGKTLR